MPESICTSTRIPVEENHKFGEIFPQLQKQRTRFELWIQKFKVIFFKACHGEERSEEMVCIYNLMINGYICVLLAAPAAAAAAAKLYSVQGILYWNTNYQQSPILSQAICVMPQINWHLAIL